MPPITCSNVIAQASDFIDDAVDESTSASIQQHLEGCDSCPTYLVQLRTTIGILRDRPGVEVPAELVAAINEAMAGTDEVDAARAAAEANNADLLALARTLTGDDAEDLLQQTWVRAFDEGAGAFDRARLIQIMTSIASGGTDPEVGSLQDDVQDTIATELSLDADADTAELFYPDFYVDGPDAGGFVEQPNVWGESQVLSPEADLTSNELYGVVDAALEELGLATSAAVALVDIEGLDRSSAADQLGIDAQALSAALARGRHHVRGRLDSYLQHRPR